MATRKIPIDPPDTAFDSDDSSIGSLSEASEHNCAENSESFDSNSEKNECVEYAEAPEPRIHPVLVTVTNDGNGSSFLANLLINLQYVDNSARILPHPEAASHFVPIQRSTDIPKDESARRFVSAYILDVRVTPQGDMKGKVWIQSQAKFSNIKRNNRFLEWLTSSTTRPPTSRINLTRSDMQGTTIVSTGLFLNIVPRFDLVDNFQDQIAHALRSTIAESGPIPEFQIEPFQVNGVAGVTRLYKMLTASISSAEIINAKMAKIMPNPSRKEVNYISFQVWGLLSKPKKIAYYAMQKNFSDNHGAMILKGVRNSKAIIGKMNDTGTQIVETGADVSIYSWLTRLVATDGFRLFPKILPCRNGEIELWHHRSHAQEAKAWATTALVEIARLSRVKIQTERQRADELFTDPDIVQAKVEKLRTEVSLPAARTAYMDFQPPAAPTPSSRATQYGQRNKRRGHNPHHQVKLVFDLDHIPSEQEPEEHSRTRWANTSRPKQRDNEYAGRGGHTNKAQAPVLDTTEEGVAKRAAATAIQTANELTKKFPAKGNTAYQGAYDTLADKFGNLIPVVELDGKWVVLNERSLIASRKQEQPPIFGISGAVYPASQPRKSAMKGAKSGTAQPKKKRWGDEDSSDDEWTKEQNISFASQGSGADMEMELAAEQASTSSSSRAHDEEHATGKMIPQEAAEAAETAPTQVVAPSEATTADMSIDTAGNPAYYDVENAARHQNGTSFADTVTRQLFNKDAAASELLTQSFIEFVHATEQCSNKSTLTMLQPVGNQDDNRQSGPTHNAEPPGRLGVDKIQKHGKINKKAIDSDWTTVTTRTNRGGRIKKLTEAHTMKQTQHQTIAEEAAPVGKPKEKSRTEDLIARLEQKNTILENKNVELALMMTENTRLLSALLLQNESLQTAFSELKSSRQVEEENRMRLATNGDTGDEQMHIVESAHTPVKARHSKKSSSVLLVERTPPKSPEGTPQKHKKKRVSESPASSKANRFSPLQDEDFDEEDSFADAEEDNKEILALVLAAEEAESVVADGHNINNTIIIPELVTVAEAHESDASDVQQAAATSPPITNSPGFGSNGAGQEE